MADIPNLKIRELLNVERLNLRVNEIDNKNWEK